MSSTNLYPIDSVGIFKIFWQMWRIMGVNGFQNQNMGFVYNILLNVIITFWYPVHLSLGLFMLSRPDEIFKNLSMTITCIVCSFKYSCLRWNLGQIREVEALLQQLDRRVKSRQEFSYFNEGTRRNANLVAKGYCAVYTGVNVAGISSILFASEKRLMYPAWFPFDWQSSSLTYWLALVYQIVGVSMQILQNLLNDATAPVVLCLFGGHVRLLSMRVSTIGYDAQKTSEDNVNDLKMCVEDHVNLIRYIQLFDIFMTI